VEHAGMSDERQYPDIHDRMEALAILAEIRMSRIEKQQAEIERLRRAARFAHAAIKTYHTMYPHRATGALLNAAGRLWEVLGDE
jgi:hypothetical protein